MDSRSDVDNSLHGGTGQPKWMKRASERHDYTDICSSPPSIADGFIHMKHSAPEIGKPVECFDHQKKKTSSRLLEEATPLSGIGNMNPDGRNMLAGKDCSKSPETSNFFKSSSTLVSLASSQAVGLITLPGSVFKGNTGNNPTRVVEVNVAKPTQNVQQFSATETNAGGIMRTIQSAPSLGDTNPSQPSKITKPDVVGRPNSELAFPHSPETTPFSTPAVTPSCSPQTQRRGNPFFTGSIQGTSNSGSWLFRPANFNTEKRIGERGNVLYEAKLDLPSSQSADIARKKVRYVPRPSELRELNFWSPTSM